MHAVVLSSLSACPHPNTTQPIRGFLPSLCRGNAEAPTTQLALPLAAALFFAAHRFFIAMDSAFRPASVRPPFLAGTRAFAGIAVGVVATGAGASAAAFAALIAAQRFFVPAIIARLPAALIFRFTGAVGPTVAVGFESRSTDGSTGFRPGPVAFSVVVVP